MRIGLAFHGDPMSPSAWSGTPAGLARAFQELGHEVIPLSAQPPQVWDVRALRLLALPYVLPELAPMLRGQSWGETAALARGTSRISLGYKALGSAMMRRALKAAGRLDLVVRLGTSFEVAHPCVVTYEDLTVRQVIRAGWDDWARLDKFSQDRRVSAQGRAYRSASAVCAATPWAARSMLKEYGASPKKVHAVGIGINRSIPARHRNWQTPRFLFVGKDWVDKNGPTLLEAFAHVHAMVPEATLDVVGHHPRIDQPGVQGHGFQPLGSPESQRLMHELYGRATCLVVPTSFEPAGIVYLEAAGAGIPSIGPSSGGAGDLIGRGGMTVAPGNTQELVAAMMHMTDATAAQSMGVIARQRAPLFTWLATAQRILQSAALSQWDESLWSNLFPEQPACSAVRLEGG